MPLSLLHAVLYAFDELHSDSALQAVLTQNTTNAMQEVSQLAMEKLKAFGEAHPLARVANTFLVAQMLIQVQKASAEELWKQHGLFTEEVRCSCSVWVPRPPPPPWNACVTCLHGAAGL